MSFKRKFEEYCDPDYVEQSAKIQKCIPSLSVSGNITGNYEENRLNKICKIINIEFKKELNIKEHEVMEIQERILSTKKLLHRVRYAIVSNYYNSKTIDNMSNLGNNYNNSNRIFNDDISSSSFINSGNVSNCNLLQNAIHPAIKNILATKETDYDYLLKGYRPQREAAKTAKTTITEKLRTKTEEKRIQREAIENTKTKSSSNNNTQNIYNHFENDELYINDNSNSNKSADFNVNTKNITKSHKKTNKIPRHISPIKFEKPIEQLNSARGVNQTKHLIVVGNTSKYIGNEKQSDGVTHKWLVYIQTRTSTAIEKLINKVRFFLHPSYRPNDIVDV